MTDLYFFTCARCGAEVQTPQKTGECPKCGGQYELVWPAAMPQPAREKR